MDIAIEIRNWLVFVSVLVGAYVAIRTYRASQAQRRLENSFRLLKMFDESLQEGDLDAWAAIFRSSSDPAGATPGHFVDVVDDQRHQVRFSELFAEGPPDRGATQRMAELFEVDPTMQSSP